MTEEKKTNDRFATKRQLVWFFLDGCKKYFLASVFFAGCVSLLDLINPRIIGYTVDAVLNDGTYELPAVLERWIASIGGPAVIRENLWWIALIVISVGIAGALCRFMWRFCNTKAAESLVQRMRNTLFEHILHLPYAWHSENHTGDIIQRCTSDVDTVKMFLSEQLTSLVRISVLIVLALYFMFQIHVRLAFLSLAFIPIIISYSYIFHRKISGAFRHADEEEGRLSAIAQENLTGVRVVRAFGRESYERERFEKKNTEYTNMWVRLMRILSTFWATSDIFSGLQILTVTAVGAVFTVHGEMSAGDYIAFISYNAMLTWPVRMLGRVISNLSRAGISIERIRYIMNSPAESDRPGAVEAPMDKDIVFDHVTYQYDNGSGDILKDVSFTVPAGTTFGILGGTGSGKSTLMYLMDRLYDLPEENGTITIGGVDIRNMKADWVRSQIGMVLQEPYLFSRTLSENIRIAAQDAGMPEIRNAARIASLDESIERFQDGYETYVGERGVTLSGGQKQRTAIAQMLIRKPPIMVFDDSLSAVDAETDAKIRAAIHENSGESTVILIAHRLTTLMHADHIIVLDRGKIAEEGTHEELLKGNGIYRRIYDLQTMQENREEE